MGSRKFLFVCLLIAVGGCGPQNPSVAPENSSIQKSQNTPAGTQAGASILQHNGCTIDLAKVCKSYIDQPQFTYNGDEYTWQRFQQSFSRHPDVEIWARYPDGSVVADIECHVDTQNRKVDWARLLPNPPIADKAWEYAKSEQWCQEQSPDYSTWGQYWRSGITHQ